MGNCIKDSNAAHRGGGGVVVPIDASSSSSSPLNSVNALNSLNSLNSSSPPDPLQVVLLDSSNPIGLLASVVGKSHHRDAFEENDRHLDSCGSGSLRRESTTNSTRSNSSSNNNKHNFRNILKNNNCCGISTNRNSGSSSSAKSTKSHYSHNSHNSQNSTNSTSSNDNKNDNQNTENGTSYHDTASSSTKSSLLIPQPAQSAAPTPNSPNSPPQTSGVMKPPSKLTHSTSPDNSLSASHSGPISQNQEHHVARVVGEPNDIWNKFNKVEEIEFESDSNRDINLNTDITECTENTEATAEKLHADIRVDPAIAILPWGTIVKDTKGDTSLQTSNPSSLLVLNNGDASVISQCRLLFGEGAENSNHEVEVEFRRNCVTTTPFGQLSHFPQAAQAAQVSQLPTSTSPSATLPAPLSSSTTSITSAAQQDTDNSATTSAKHDPSAVEYRATTQALQDEINALQNAITSIKRTKKVKQRKTPFKRPSQPSTWTTTDKNDPQQPQLYYDNSTYNQEMNHLVLVTSASSSSTSSSMSISPSSSSNENELKALRGLVASLTLENREIQDRLRAQFEAEKKLIEEQVRLAVQQQEEDQRQNLLRDHQANIHKIQSEIEQRLQTEHEQDKKEMERKFAESTSRELQSMKDEKDAIENRMKAELEQEKINIVTKMSQLFQVEMEQQMGAYEKRLKEEFQREKETQIEKANITVTSSLMKEIDMLKHEKTTLEERLRSDFEERATQLLQSEQAKAAEQQQQLRNTFALESQSMLQQLQNDFEMQKQKIIEQYNTEIQTLRQQLETMQSDQQQHLEIERRGVAVVQQALEQEMANVAEAVKETQRLQEQLQILSNEKKINDSAVAAAQAAQAATTASETQKIEEMQRHIQVAESQWNDERNRLINLVDALKLQIAEMTLQQQQQKNNEDNQKQQHLDVDVLEKQFSASNELRVKESIQFQEHIEELQHQLTKQQELTCTLLKQKEQELKLVFAKERKELENRIEQIRQDRMVSDSRIRQEHTFTLERLESEKNELLETIDYLKKELDKAKAMDELDDILGQLDLVEAEHKELVDAKNKALEDKDVIISALGTQMGESKRRIDSLEMLLSEQVTLTEVTQAQADSLKEELRLLQTEYEVLFDKHERFVVHAATEKERACEDAREEMIARAEQQFQQANEHYVKLKREFDSAQDRIAELNDTVAKLNKKVESLSHERKTLEKHLQGEISRITVTHTQAVKDAASQQERDRTEIKRLLQVIQELEYKLKLSDETSRSIQVTLAKVITSKERLQLEYNEMKAVSEELMSIVEANSVTSNASVTSQP